MADKVWKGPGVLKDGEKVIKPGEFVPMDKLDKGVKEYLEKNNLLETPGKPKAETKKGKKK